ncbi:MAG TPA: helical backbone metal receptor [Bacteroidia bacterium]|nr:ABC transporter substrate-binding protein [Bacteroidia bacterium]QQR94726.1 MAG: ABC transporter substrate-binding protein [Bacteroidota bacterium]MBP7715258.1 ABC transporter substrate-binding protein [Bacteroidia bacterium]MBP8668710.1 ABC transporter substrate-binding protein [Bacteroidia bacterium]HOZ82724.1 helical backbone metal receptor [Bacteroidia bacterium]
MLKFIDQTGFEIKLETPPQRIVSLVPSQTELLADLGLQDRIVGITKYCIYPPELFLSVPRVGGTKSVNHELINQLKPDIIIANKEENNREAIEQLRKNFPVWLSDVSNLHEALDMIYNIGVMTDCQSRASEINSQIAEKFAALTIKNKKHTAKRALYFIWRNPYMCVGGDTFISDMMNMAGYDNLMYYHKRYPELSEKKMAELNPEIILLSSEPYPFKARHIEEFKTICPKAEIKLVDGEFFAWYGSRMIKAADYFHQLCDSNSNVSE